MLSATLKSGLSGYEIGGKIRGLRLKKKMGLVELGRHTGLSPALLSKIERGRLFPTLPTLLRIALVFSVGLDFFFAGARERPLLAVVRRAQRVKLPDKAGSHDVAYRFESLDYPATERRFNSYYADFFPVAADSIRVHVHPGVEFIYVLRGALVVRVGGEEHTLARGDAMYFDSSVPHGYRRHGRAACSAIVVTTA
ncbi:MAG TPA: XRE family transcriptional regulator [Vicinamibacterales bacterium]|jgi:transcriptional regulator with XRE-family HTH domain|nr:XRE family transcriptional regulator [Vicinamibacterales bacterium]